MQGTELIKQWLEQINKTITTHELEVIVVCAGGIPIQHSRIDNLVILDKNESFSHSMNAGLRLATGDYLIIMNNDAFPIKASWVDDLVSEQQRLGAVLLSPVLTNPAMTVYKPFICKETDTEYKVAFFPAVCWFISRKNYLAVGEFDERFKPCYYEDNDYVMRIIQNLEDKIFVTKKVTVVHLLSKDTNVSRINTNMEESARLFKEKWKL